MRANATGTMVSGYRANVDDSMTLENVDLTGANRAWMDIEIFGHYGWSGAFAQDSNGFYLVELWDHIGMIEGLERGSQLVPRRMQFPSPDRWALRR